MIPSSLKKGGLKAFKLAGRGIMVLSVFFAIITIYSQLTSPKEEQLTFSDTLELVQASNQHIIDQVLLHDSSEETKLAIEIRKSMMCDLTGDMCGPGVDPKQAFQDSTTGKVAQFLTFPIKNPPSSGMYVASKAIEQAGFVPETYAQDISNRRGLGFASIEHIASVWKALRNFSYVVIALIMVGIGFMIMFRMQMNAQTVVSIENSIPRIILALIFITFSFAIAGFIIDLMYISIIIIAGVFGVVGKVSPTDIIDTYMFANPGTLLKGVMGGPGATGGDGSIAGDGWGLDGIFWTLPGAIIGILGDGVDLVLHLVGAVIGAKIFVFPLVNYLSTLLSPELKASAFGSAIFAGAEGGLTFPALVSGILKGQLSLLLTATILLPIGAFLARLAVGFFIFLTFLILAMKIFNILLTAYIRILIYIIFAPLILLADALPGKGVFSSWFRSLLAEVATFPITIVLFLVGALVIQSAFAVEACDIFDFSNENCKLATLPFLWGFDAQSFSLLVGFGFLLVTPEFIENLKKGLNPSPLNLMSNNAGIGMFFGSLGGTKKVGMGALGGVASRNGGLWATTKVLDKIGKSPGKIGELARGASEALNPKKSSS